jgi:hypothetical protein
MAVLSGLPLAIRANANKIPMIKPKKTEQTVMINVYSIPVGERLPVMPIDVLTVLVLQILAGSR